MTLPGSVQIMLLQPMLLQKLRGPGEEQLRGCTLFITQALKLNVIDVCVEPGEDVAVHA